MHFQRNRLLVVPWLINSFVSLLYSGVAMTLALFMALSAKYPDYASVVPFGVATLVIFGKIPTFQWSNYICSDLIFLFLCVFVGIYVYAYLAIYSLYQHIRLNTPNSEHSGLINGGNATYPSYTRCWIQQNSRQLI